MAQRRRSCFENSPTGVLLLFAEFENPWLRNAAEDERRAAGRILWNSVPEEMRSWALRVSRAVRQEPDTARLWVGVRILAEAALAYRPSLLLDEAGRSAADAVTGSGGREATRGGQEAARDGPEAGEEKFDDAGAFKDGDLRPS